MKITVTTLTGGFYPLEVAEDLELENFKALLEFEAEIPAGDMAILWNGRTLSEDKKTLKEYGIGDGEVLLLQRKQSTTTSPQSSAPAGMGIDFGAIQIPGQPSTSQARPPGMQQMPEDPDTIREMLLASPHELAILKERNPPLADALLSGNKEKFAEVLGKQQKERAEKERERIRLLTADPFDHTAQQAIAEEIRMKNVESNMEAAMEYSPESFGQVVMLYIDCTVNGYPVKAFVDSGAQMTIMSQQCAERCNIMRLVDRRWAGVAKGVGTQKIIGRVHLGQIQIGEVFLQSSFSILEDQPMDMLLGLDMLKRHQCTIDLKHNKLTIGTTGKETPFLPESELPVHARLNRSESAGNQMDEDGDLAQALAKSAAEASGSQGSTSSQQSSQGPSTPSFPEPQINLLTQYGFSREQVIQELQKSNGNTDAALAALFAKSLAPPK